MTAAGRSRGTRNPVAGGDRPADADGPPVGLAADVEDFAAGRRARPVGAGVARGVRGDGRLTVLHDDRDAVAVGRGHVGGLLAHGLRQEVDEDAGPQRGHRPTGDAGVAIAGGPQRLVDAGTERGLDQVGVAGGEQAVDPQPALERAGDVQAADLVGLACSGLAGSGLSVSAAAASQWRAASRKPSAFNASACCNQNASWSTARSG